MYHHLSPLSVTLSHGAMAGAVRARACGITRYLDTAILLMGCPFICSSVRVVDLRGIHLEIADAMCQ